VHTLSLSEEAFTRAGAQREELPHERQPKPAFSLQ